MTPIGLLTISRLYQLWKLPLAAFTKDATGFLGCDELIEREAYLDEHPCKEGIFCKKTSKLFFCKN